MFRKVNEISGVYFYDIAPYLAVKKKNSIELYNKQLAKITSFEAESNSAHTEFYNKYIHVLSPHSENWVYSYDGELVLQTKGVNYYHIHDLNHILKFDRATKNTVYKECVLEGIKISDRLIEGHKIYFTAKNSRDKLLCYNLKNCEFEWVFDLGKISSMNNNADSEHSNQVSSILGIWNNKLIVGCKKSLLVSIDIYSGMIEGKWEQLSPNCSEFDYLKGDLPTGYKLTLDNNNGIVYSLFGQLYFELDLSSGDMYCYSIKEHFNDLGILTFKGLRPPFDDKYIYSITHVDSGRFGSNALRNGIIAFNRKTKKIDWFEIIWKEGLGTITPRIDENRLYQLGLGHTLFVYEREDIANDID